MGSKARHHMFRPLSPQAAVMTLVAPNVVRIPNCRTLGSPGMIALPGIFGESSGSKCGSLNAVPGRKARSTQPLRMPGTYLGVFWRLFKRHESSGTEPRGAVEEGPLREGP